MTDKQSEKAERLVLQNILKKQPKLKEIIDNLIDNPNPDLNDVLQPTIEHYLKQEQMRGIAIGYHSALLYINEKIKTMNDSEEIKKYILNETLKAKQRMKMNKTYYDIQGDNK